MKVYSCIATLVTALGLGLALYLSALKLFALPCVGGGDCGAVIHSRYGALLGIPVGVYAAGLWFVVLAATDRWRLAALLVLGVGSIGFVAIQLWVLEQLCFWCCAHSAMTWIALGFFKQKPARLIALLLGVALAVGGYAIGRQAVLESVNESRSAWSVLANENVGSDWLGPVGADSPALVLSLTCPKCLDLMAELAAMDISRNKTGPAIFLKTDVGGEDLTLSFVAAVARQGSGPDAFFTVSGILLSRLDLVLGNPAGAAVWLQSIFPVSDAEREAAKQIVSAQASALKEMGIATTPLLLPRHAPATIDFSIKDFLPASP